MGSGQAGIGPGGIVIAVNDKHIHTDVGSQDRSAPITDVSC